MYVRSGEGSPTKRLHGLTGALPSNQHSPQLEPLDRPRYSSPRLPFGNVRLPPSLPPPSLPPSLPLYLDPWLPPCLLAGVALSLSLALSAPVSCHSLSRALSLCVLFVSQAGQQSDLERQEASLKSRTGLPTIIEPDGLSPSAAAGGEPTIGRDYVPTPVDIF